MIECKVATLSTFLGPVTVVETARGVRHVDLLDDGARQFAREAAGRFLRLPGEPECAQEFRDYFAGRLDLKRALLRFEGWAWPEEWDALVPNAAEIPDAGALTRPGER